MSSSFFIESPGRNKSLKKLSDSQTDESDTSNDDQEIDNDFDKGGPSNLVVVYGSNGIQVNHDELQKLVADESNLSTISVIRLTSPTPSMKLDDDEEEQKSKLKYIAKKNLNNENNDNTLNKNPDNDSCEDNSSETHSFYSDEEYSEEGLLATLNGTERQIKKNKKRYKNNKEKPESAGLIIEDFYPPEQAKILAKEILSISGIKRLTTKADKKLLELQLLAYSNDHCYTPLLSPTQEPVIEKIPDNKVPIQPPEKIQQKLNNLKQSAIAKQRSSSNDSSNKLDAKHKNSTDELTADNESDSEDQSDEESESVDTDNDRDSDLDFSVYGAGKRKVRRTKKISINKITNKRQRRQSSHDDEELIKKKNKALHRLSSEGTKIKTDTSLIKMKTIDSNQKLDKTEKLDNPKSERYLFKIQQKMPTTPLIPLGVGKSVSQQKMPTTPLIPLGGKSISQQKLPTTVLTPLGIGKSILQQKIPLTGYTSVGSKSTVQQKLPTTSYTTVGGGKSILQQKLPIADYTIPGGKSTVQQKLPIADYIIPGGKTTVQQKLPISGYTTLGGKSTSQLKFPTTVITTLGGKSTSQQKLSTTVLTTLAGQSSSHQKLPPTTILTPIGTAKSILRQKLPVTALIPLGVGKSTSLLRKTITETENITQHSHAQFLKEELPKPMSQNVVIIKPQEKISGTFTDISKYLTKFGGEGEIINSGGSGSIVISRKPKEPITSTVVQFQQVNPVQRPNKITLGKEGFIPVITEDIQTSDQLVTSFHEDKELIDSLVNVEILQPMSNHSQMNIPNLVKMLESSEHTILNQHSNEVSTFQQQNQITDFSNSIVNTNVDDIAEDLLKDVAELIDNNTLAEFAETQAFKTQQNNNIIEFDANIPTNLLANSPPHFSQHKIPEQIIIVKDSSELQKPVEMVNVSQNSQFIQSQSLIKPAVQVVQRNGRIITLPPIEAPNTRAKRKAATGNPAAVTSNQISNSNSVKQTNSSSRRNSKESNSAKNTKAVAESRQNRVSTSSQKHSEKSFDENDLNPDDLDEDDFEDDENDTDFNEDDDPDKLWCVCRQPHNNRFMICCDVCEEWFHGTCVNVTKATGLEMEQNGIDWTCPKCIRARKPVQRKISEMFEKVIDSNININIEPKILNKTPELKRNIPQTSAFKQLPLNRTLSDSGEVSSSSQINRPGQKNISDNMLIKICSKSESEDRFERKSDQNIDSQINKPAIKQQPFQPQMMREETKKQQAAREQRAKDQALKEQALKEQALKEQALKEQALKEKALKEQAVREEALKEQILKEQAIKEQILMEEILKDPTIKEYEVMERPVKEETINEYTIKVQTIKEQAVKEIVKDQMYKVQTNKAVEHTIKEDIPSDLTSKLKQSEEEIVECIVCKKEAKSNSIYCSDDCIRKYAQNAISLKVKSTSSEVAKKKSSFEEALGAAAVIVTPKKIERISVFERKSGKIVTGLNAPTTISLKKWLHDNPTYEVIQSGSTNQTTTDTKQRLQSQTSIESVNAQDILSPIKNTTKADALMSKVDHLSLSKPIVNSTKVIKPLMLAIPSSSSKSQSIEKKFLKYPSNTSLKLDKNDKIDKQVKPKLVIQRELKETNIKTKQNQNTVRENIVKNFREQLTARMNEITSDDHPKLSEFEIEKFANEIEEEMFSFFNKDAASVKYRIKYRSLQFNLNDRKNTTLFHKICAKMVEPKQLVRMSPEELASQELAAWRQQENKHQLEMIKNAELDLLACTKNYVLKTHKGEEVIESKSSDCINLDIAHIPVEDVVAILNNSTVSSTSELDQSNSSVKDTYKHHYESKSSSSKHSDNKKRSDHSKDREKREKHHKSKDRHKEKHRKRSRSRSRDRSSRHSGSNQGGHGSHGHNSSNQGGHGHSSSNQSSHGHSSSNQGSHGHRDDRISKEDKKSHDKHRDKKMREKSSDKSAVKVHIAPAFSTVNSSSTKTENTKSKSIEPFNLVDQILESSTKSIEHAANLESTKPKVILKHENYQETISVQHKLNSLPSPLDSDQEPTSTVQIPTPPNEEEITYNPFSVYGRGIILWNGSINMIDVATFQINIQPISGQYLNLEKDLSSELDVVGRISPDTVWDYIAKIKKSRNKEILIVRLVPATESENIGYSALYMYLDKRKRLGVIKSETPSIKDFYLLPLGAKKTIPSLLKTSENADIFEDESRPDLLLGIVIRVMGLNYIQTAGIKRSAIADISMPNNKIIRRKEESVISHKEHSLERTEGHTPPGSPSLRISTSEPHSILNIGGKLPTKKKESQNFNEIINLSSDLPATMGDDEPYSPGGSSENSRHTIPGLCLSISKDDDELKRKMDEINRQIEVQEMEIAGMLGASNSSSDSYSPSNTLNRTLQAPSLANISIPSNLQQILASIQKPPPPPLEEEYNPEEPINSLMESKTTSRLAQLTEEELLSMVPDNIDINVPKKDTSYFSQPPPPGLEDDEEFTI